MRCDHRIFQDQSFRPSPQRPVYSCVKALCRPPIELAFCVNCRLAPSHLYSEGLDAEKRASGVEPRCQRNEFVRNSACLESAKARSQGRSCQREPGAREVSPPFKARRGSRVDRSTVASGRAKQRRPGSPRKIQWEGIHWLAAHGAAFKRPEALSPVDPYSRAGFG